MKTCRQQILTSKKEMQNSLKKKKNSYQFCTTTPLGHIGENFDPNQMSAYVHEDLQITNTDVQERNAKFLRKKKNKVVLILSPNATGSDWPRILTYIKCWCVCIKTCRQQLQASKKEMQNSLGKKKKLVPIWYQNATGSNWSRILI